MVRLAGFSAVNQERTQDERLAAQETLEAQEARIVNEYDRAMRHLRSENIQAAEVR